MIIVFCIDENYKKYAKISIASYRQHNPKAHIVIVTEGDGVFTGLGEDEEVVIKLPQKFRNRGEGDRISNTAYLKCFLTKLPYDKIIYVDADTICQQSLEELWNLPCTYINLCESHRFGEKQAEAIQSKKYGLTGMMVMNLTNLRKIQFTKKCLDVEKNYPTPITGWQHDETCINVAMKDKLGFIDKKFNYCHDRVYKNPIAEKDAVILHIVGKDKSYMKYYGGDEPEVNSRYPELEKIREEITGKRIAIVGNASSIFDKQNGNEIDKHDFVIRFNKGFICDPKCQGNKTSLLILACPLPDYIAKSYNAKYIANRSKSYKNAYADFTINNLERAIMKEGLGSQPSSGFMAINICLYFKAAHIDLYGFDWVSQSWPNDPNYQTLHNYNKEKSVIFGYVSAGLVSIY